VLLGKGIVLFRAAGRWHCVVLCRVLQCVGIVSSSQVQHGGGEVLRSIAQYREGVVLLSQSRSVSFGQAEAE